MTGPKHSFQPSWTLVWAAFWIGVAASGPIMQVVVRHAG